MAVQNKQYQQQRQPVVRTAPNNAQFQIADISDINQEKLIPFNQEAEEAVIGALLIDSDNAHITLIATVLKPADFFSERCRLIYIALLKLWEHGRAIDLITVRDELKRMNAHGDGDGKVPSHYIIDLMRVTATPFHSQHHAEIVLRFCLNRTLVGLGAEITKMGFEDTQTVGEKLEAIHNKLAKIEARLAGKRDNFTQSAKDLAEFAFRVAEKSEKALYGSPDTDAWNTVSVKGGVPITGTKMRLGFGIEDLDGNATKNKSPLMLLEPSMMLGIMADTSVGKTAFALKVAIYNFLRGANVIYLHPELSNDDLGRRIITMLSYSPLGGNKYTPYISTYNQRRPETMNEAQQAELVRIAGVLANSETRGKFESIHTTEWSVEQVTELVKGKDALWRSQGKGGVHLVVMDYLQRHGAPRGYNPDNKASYMSDICNSYGNLANALDTCVLLLSQVVDTPNSQKEGKWTRPTLHNSLWTRDFGRFCAAVLGLWRHDQQPDLAELEILKYNDGAAGAKLSLAFDAERFEFL